MATMYMVDEHILAMCINAASQSVSQTFFTAIGTKDMFKIQGLPHLMTTPIYTPTMPWVPYLPMSIDRVSESK